MENEAAIEVAEIISQLQRDASATAFEKLRDPTAVGQAILRGDIARPRALDHYEECRLEMQAQTVEMAHLRTELAEVRRALAEMGRRENELRTGRREAEEKLAETIALRDHLAEALADTVSCGAEMANSYSAIMEVAMQELPKGTAEQLGYAAAKKQTRPFALAFARERFKQASVALASYNQARAGELQRANVSPLPFEFLF